MRPEALDPAMKNIFEGWGLYSVPDWLDEKQKVQVLAISAGLGCLFGDDREAEKNWMQTPMSCFKSRPITIVLAGRMNEVLDRVNLERMPQHS